MRKIFFIMVLFIVMLFVKDNKCNAISSTIIEGVKIYNMDVVENYIVYEYEESANLNNYHYIGIYNKNNGTHKKILSNKGEYINADMVYPTISNNGRYVSFTSRATNITGDSLQLCYNIINEKYEICSNIYIYDAYTETSILLKSNGNLFNGDNYISVISGNGQNVVFESISTNNLNFDTASSCSLNKINICTNIYKYNMMSGTVMLVSTNINNKGGNFNSMSPAISDDGRYVVFQSPSTNLTSDYGNNKCANIDADGNSLCTHIYLADTQNFQLNIITKNDSSLFNDSSGNAMISKDGNFIVYESYASNIEESYSNNLNLVIYDIVNNQNVIISKNGAIFNNRDSYLLDVSKNGKYILYKTKSTNLINSSNSAIYIYNLSSKKTTLSSNCFSFDILAKVDEDNIYCYEKDSLIYTKIDNEPPIISDNQEIYIIKNTSPKALKEKIEVIDNLCNKEELSFFINNNLIFNSIGEYEISISMSDTFGNISSNIIKVIVIDKDEEGPIFSEINKIRILKGSSTLNLANYISAVDKIDGETRIYIIDDGNLDLNSAGRYKIKLMAQDNCQNISYKEIEITVYENYSFEYFYEFLLIIGVIAIIIFSIIRVK